MSDTFPFLEITVTPHPTHYEITKWWVRSEKWTGSYMKTYELDIPPEIPLAGRLALRLMRERTSVTPQQIAICWAVAEEFEP